MAISDRHQTGEGLKGILPFLTALFFAVFSVMPIEVPLAGKMAPFLTMIAVYYWTVFKPDLMPPVAVFTVGLIQDILGGGPLGMMAFLLLAVRQFIMFQGRAFLERDFLFNWMIFVIFALVFGVAYWGLTSFYVRELVNFWNALGQSTLTIIFFPAVVWLLRFVLSQLKTEKR